MGLLLLILSVYLRLWGFDFSGLVFVTGLCFTSFLVFVLTYLVLYRLVY